MIQRSNRTSRLWLAFTPAMLALACGTHPVTRPTVQVRINELTPSNHKYVDDIGATDDWIELYNLSSEDADLTGYFISDSQNRRFKVQLTEAAVVPAHGLLFLWADEEPTQGALHLNFKLSSEGDGVCLSTPEGYAVDCVEFAAMPPYDAGSTQDISLARFPDGTGNFQWCGVSSPEVLNGSHCTKTAL